MKQFLILILFFFFKTQLGAQQLEMGNIANVGTQLVSISNYDYDSPSVSVSGGLGRYWYKKDSTNIKKISHYIFVSLAIDRFTNSNYYRFSEQNDRIQFTRITIDFEAQRSVFYFSWPFQSSLLVNSGISINPVFVADNYIDNEHHRVFITPQWINPFIGLGLQTRLSDQWQFYIGLDTYLFANFELDSFDFHDVVNLQQPNLLTLSFSMRYLW